MWDLIQGGVGLASLTALVVAVTGLTLGWVLVVFGAASLVGYLAVRRFIPGGRGAAKTYLPDEDLND